MLLSNLDLLATAPGGVARLRELILTLAVQGKLLPQDPADEPASVLLKKIRAEKDRLIAEGKIKRDKPLAGIADDEKPFELPQGWKWVRMGALVNSSEAGWSPSCNNTPRCGDDWGVLKVSAVSWGNFNPEANKELPANLAPRPEYEVKDGDFLLSRANTEELVARSVVVGTTPPKLMLSDKIIRLDVSSHVHRAFLNLSNNANHSRAHYVVHASGTSSSMKNVSREVVLNTPVPLPPLAEQSRIVTRVEELMRLCDALEAKGRLEAAQHAQLVTTLLATLTDSATPEALTENWQRLATHFDTLLDRPEAVDALEQTVLQLAVRGLLVPQDPADEHASTLLKHIRSEKDRLIAAGQIKRDKPLEPITEDEKPFELPVGWEWVRFGEASINRDGERIPVSSSDRDNRSKIYDYYGASGVIDKIDGFLFDKTLLLIGEDGANLINRSTPIAFLAHGKYWVNNHAHVIDTTHPVLMDYLALFVNAISLEAYVTGTAQPKMNQAKLNSILIALPPLAEQSRIVARVESLRRLCAQLRQSLARRKTIQDMCAMAVARKSCVGN